MLSAFTPLLPEELAVLAAPDWQGRRLVVDSRKVTAGDVFVACQGEYSDGRQYIQAALDNGAAAVIWDADGVFQWQPQWTVPNLPVRDLRARAGMVAAAYLGYPAAQMTVIGVTGTNGKTSISQWLAQALDGLGRRCAIMGTVGNGFWGHLQESSHTTLDPVTLQNTLAQLRQQGAAAVAMEVSSHGLDQHRVSGVPFSSAIFTNLTRDHLDYHGDMATYGAIKSRLFYWPGLRHAAINLDDAFGADLMVRLRQERPELNVLSYGFAEQADVRITGFQAALAGTELSLKTPWGAGRLQTGLLGRFNAQNLAACVAVLCAEGFALADVLTVLGTIQAATGRMDSVRVAGAPLVVVDYAHTPDALEKALGTLQEVKAAHSRLWCVFGCGGNRDRGKRPLMGAAAQAYADCVVVTSDNPRMEAPEDIINDILPAVPQPAYVDADRQAAIAYAVRHAAPDDIILIAGKGHETYQDAQGEKHHFSDFEVALAALQQRVA